MDHNFKPKLSKNDFGWYKSGSLPHLDAEGFTQFITFRLADSLPRGIADKLKREAEDELAYLRAVEHELDAGHGKRWLGRAEIAEIVENALLFHHRKSYDLHAWVIMPTHVHLAATQLPGKHLPDIMHSVKSFTANAANKLLKRTGSFWQHESFDRYIRNYQHFSRVIRYIENNPVKAGLCKKKEDWPWSSAKLEGEHPARP